MLIFLVASMACWLVIPAAGVADLGVLSLPRTRAEVESEATAAPDEGRVVAWWD